MRGRPLAIIHTPSTFRGTAFTLRLMLAYLSHCHWLMCEFGWWLASDKER